MAIINGQITSIDSEIVNDIEVLVKVAKFYEEIVRFVDKHPVAPLKEINDAAPRVSDYLATYKLDDEHGE